MGKMYIPGEHSQTFPYLDVIIDGGPDGSRAIREHVWVDTVVSHDPPTFQLAVRTSDRTFHGLAMLSSRPEDEQSYEESMRHAKALARAWHIETYVFDGWEKDRRFFRGTPQYRFAGAKAIVAKAGTSRWYLDAGSSIAVPTPGAVEATADRWDQVCSNIEESCNAFHSIAALFPADTFQGSLQGPRQAVEAYRGEAKRLAAIGQSLDKAEAGGALDETIERTYAQLGEIQVAVCEAVKMASEIQLNVGAIFPDNALVEGTLDLAALAAVSQEAASAKQ